MKGEKLMKKITIYFINSFVITFHTKIWLIINILSYSEHVKYYPIDETNDSSLIYTQLDHETEFV